MEMKDVGAAAARAEGLAPEDSRLVLDLFETWRAHLYRNRLRDRYYRGHVRVKDLGVSVPPELMGRLDPRCDWAARAVDWWAERVQFDGFSCEDDERMSMLEELSWRNDLPGLSHKAATCALKHGSVFLAVSAGSVEADEPAAVVSAYPMTAGSALWDDTLKRIKAGMVVVESRKVSGQASRQPTRLNVHKTDAIIDLAFVDGRWRAEYLEHEMGRPTFVAISYHGTLEEPFGRSRITRTVMAYVDEAQRAMANQSVAAAFASAPQKYLLGVDQGVVNKIAENRYEAYIGSIMTVSPNKRGQVPTFGQLSQMSMQPHIDYFRSLAAGFSGATGVPLSSMGVVTDNPSSADAIRAAKEDAVVDIQAFVQAMKAGMQEVALMALAVAEGTDLATARAGARVDVNYRNPAMPSVVSQSDAVTKQIAALPFLAESDVVLREYGYSDEQIHQLSAARARHNAQQALVAAVGSGGGNG